MRFAQPELLYFLILIPVLVVVFISGERQRGRLLSRLTTNAKPEMVMGAAFERRLLFLIFLCLGSILLILAAARPQWGTKLEEVRARGIDIIVAIDTSMSMTAEDVSPNRMAKARQEVDKLLSILKGDRIGLVAFAGSAYTFCPLTVDYGAVRLFLSGLEPGVIEDGGTNIPAAIQTALETFERTESSAQRVLILFSDGENHEADPSEAVAKAVEAGVQIFTVGIGNAGKSGERILLEESADGQPVYKRDQAGNLVITRLDEATLQQIAEQSGGAYHRVSDAGTELMAIYNALEAKEKSAFASKVYHQMEDRYQYPLAAALIFLTIAFSLGRRTYRKMRRTQEVAT